LLLVYPGGLDADSAGFVSLSLELLPSDDSAPPPAAHFELALLDQSEAAQHLVAASRLSSPPPPLRGLRLARCSRFVSWTELFARRDAFLGGSADAALFRATIALPGASPCSLSALTLSHSSLRLRPSAHPRPAASAAEPPPPAVAADDLSTILSEFGALTPGTDLSSETGLKAALAQLAASLGSATPVPSLPSLSARLAALLDRSPSEPRAALAAAAALQGLCASGGWDGEKCREAAHASLRSGLLPSLVNALTAQLRDTEVFSEASLSVGAGALAAAGGTGVDGGRVSISPRAEALALFSQGALAKLCGGSGRGEGGEAAMAAVRAAQAARRRVAADLLAAPEAERGDETGVKESAAERDGERRQSVAARAARFEAPGRDVRTTL
jgi:hypothetical protein